MKKTTRTACVFMCLLMACTTGYSQQTIHKAAEQGNLAAIERYLQKGTDVDATDKDGCTPLNKAASCGYLNIVKVLVEKGADVNARDNIGETPLLDANGYTNVVEFLKQHGAKE